jgi:phosphoribosyl 1,2-cyclic phosphodiesterase
MDAGVSALQIRRRLAAFGCSEEEVAAVLISHEHSDHIRGLEVLSKRRPVPVWATAGTWSQLRFHASRGGELCSGATRRFGDLQVLPVATSHDAAEPVALVFDDGSHRVAVCTDTGVMTNLLRQRLADCDVLLVETNHDADMLRHGPYPWPLKQRIASRVGHLANHQTEEAVAELRSPRLKAVVGLHLSAENNLPSLVCSTLEGCAGAGVPVAAVSRTEMLRIALDGGAASLECQPVPPPRGR